jgi:UDPglucose 6-dehydrogenase
MTHLGLVSASAAAARGFRTIAFDPDPALIGRLNRGELPVNEPGLPELIHKHKRDLVFSTDVAALDACEVVYIAVDVPTDDKGQSDLSPIKAMIERVRPVSSTPKLLIRRATLMARHSRVNSSIRVISRSLRPSWVWASTKS